MVKFIKKLLRLLIKVPIKELRSRLNKAGTRHGCFVCGNTFNHFGKYAGGSECIPEFRKRLDMIGGDIDNFDCPYCSAHDRERHLYMFFDKMRIWDELRSFHVLHFAPEKSLSQKIMSHDPVQYVMADLNPKKDVIERVDATDIQYGDATFDLVICNHVLEHIPDYKKAMDEIFRVLKPGGFAILQTPYSRILRRNFEEENINTDEARLFFYGERDHCRIFSEDEFFNALKDSGFTLDLLKHSDLFDDNTTSFYGVDGKEDLVRVIKPVCLGNVR